MSVEVEEFYGRWARLYDTLAATPVSEPWRSAAVEALDLSRGDTVVEMGCGTGANIPFLRDHVGAEGRVVGIDLTRPLLDRAQARVHTANWSNVDLVRGDASRPPVSRVDAVLATFVVGLLADPAGAVETWCAIADGRVALLDGASSRHPVGRFCNPVFGACVSAGTPADSIGDTLRRLPSDDARHRLDRAVSASRESLVACTTDRRYESFGLGFVGLLSGRVD